MAATIGAAPEATTVRWTLQSSTQDKANKVTKFDGAMSDADLMEMLDSFDAITNARALTCKVGERPVTGLKGSASASAQNLISAYMVLSFEKVHPLNPLETVTKNFIVPAYVEALRGAGNNPDVGTPGTGSAAAHLGRLIEHLEDNLAYQAADGDWYNGGWTYNGGGFGTGNDVIDGE